MIFAPVWKWCYTEILADFCWNLTLLEVPNAFQRNMKNFGHLNKFNILFSQTLEWTLYKCENVEVVLYGHTSLGLLLGKENGFGIVSRDKKLISISGSLFHLNWNDFGDTLSAGSVWSFAKIISLALKGWHTVVLLTKTASSSLKAGSHTVQSDHEITHVDWFKNFIFYIDL